MNIIIAGLTGAGKTTHSTYLCNQLGFNLVCGSKIRSDFINKINTRSDKNYWLYSEEAINEDFKRLHQSSVVDERTNSLLTELVKKNQNQVFDVWFLPWHDNQSKSLKIWLDCPLNVRVQRIARELKTQKENINVLLNNINEKDVRSQLYGIKEFGVDIFKDRKPFQVILTFTEEVEFKYINLILLTIVENYLKINNKIVITNHTIKTIASNVITKCPPELFPIWI